MEKPILSCWPGIEPPTLLTPDIACTYSPWLQDFLGTCISDCKIILCPFCVSVCPFTLSRVYIYPVLFSPRVKSYLVCVYTITNTSILMFTRGWLDRSIMLSRVLLKCCALPYCLVLYQISYSMVQWIQDGTLSLSINSSSTVNRCRHISSSSTGVYQCLD